MMLFLSTQYMFGAGHIQAMMQSIKGNARSRVRKFDKNITSFTSRISGRRKPITSKKLTLKQKNGVATKLRKQRIIRMTKVITTMILIITSLIIFFYYS